MATSEWQCLTSIQSLDSTDLPSCFVYTFIMLGSSTYEITRHGEMMIVM